MIDIEILKNVLTQFYFAPYMFVAIAVYGTFRLVKLLMIGK